MATTRQSISWAILIGLFGLAFSSNSQIAAQETSAGKAAVGSVAPVPDAVRTQYKLDPFYQKHVAAGDLPIVGSANVSDAAMLEAAWIVNKLLGHRPEILTAMADNNTRLAVMAYNEFTTDIPEHAHLTSRAFWDRRARGLGATPSAPAVSCAEENLLGHPGDPYATENICIHEFAHAIHGMGMTTIDPTFDDRLKTAFESAVVRGLWKNTYAASNRQEYWAEGVQSWFDDNRENDSLHNQINTRLELKKYDPRLARLCEEVFGDGQWRYKKPLTREPQDRAHLANVDFENLPKFKWRKDHFFICVGKQPELDFGGKRNPDGQGFAAFGQVTKGMDVVKKIHQSTSAQQTLTPKIKIQRAIRLN